MMPRSLGFHRAGATRYTLALPAAVALLIALAVPAFLSAENWRNLAAQMAGLLIVSLGQLLVALVAGIDLSVGSVISLTSVLVSVHDDLAIGAALAMACGVAVGMANGLGVCLAGIHPLVMTLSTATFVQGLAYLVRATPGGSIPPALATLATGSWGSVPVPLIWCAVLASAVALLLRCSRYGLHLYATGSHAQSAALNGVPTTRVVVAAYVACSTLSVVAGLFLTARIGSGDPLLGATFGLESVTVIALGGVHLTGGIGGVLAAITGTLTLGLVSNGINLFGLSPFLRTAITGALLIAAVASQRRKEIGL